MWRAAFLARTLRRRPLPLGLPWCAHSVGALFPSGLPGMNREEAHSRSEWTTQICEPARFLIFRGAHTPRARSSLLSRPEKAEEETTRGTLRERLRCESEWATEESTLAGAGLALRLA